MDREPTGASRDPRERRVDQLPPTAIAAGVFAVTARLAAAGVPPTEARVFRLVNGLPDGLEPVLWAPMQMGSLWGPFMAGGVAWWRWRSWRPALGVVVAGVVSWQLAKVVKDHVARGRPRDEIDDVVQRLGTPTDGLGFVSGHSAVIFSVVTVLSPYVNRRTRWALHALAVVVAAARIHVGAHLPVDTVGGASLGVIVGRTWRFAVGNKMGPAG